MPVSVVCVLRCALAGQCWGLAGIRTEVPEVYLQARGKGEQSLGICGRSAESSVTALPGLPLCPSFVTRTAERPPNAS